MSVAKIIDLYILKSKEKWHVLTPLILLLNYACDVIIKLSVHRDITGEMWFWGRVI